MDIFKDIGQPANINNLEAANGYNTDIINTILNNYKNSCIESSLISENFRGKNNLETARKIWNFLKFNIDYKKDPFGYQFIKLPRKFLKDKSGDCKSFALFTAGILNNLGLKSVIKYASYNSSTIPTHVYCTTENENGQTIIIDAVWKKFNEEKTPTHTKKYIMQVYTLSGHEENYYSINGKKKEKKGLGKKILFAAGRAPFLALVGLNVRGMANKLFKAIAKDRNKVKKMWENLGGTFTKLEAVIVKGNKRKRIFGTDETEIGMDPATLAALTAAAPVIVVILTGVMQIIGKKGSKEDQAAGEPPTDKVIDDAAKDLPTGTTPEDVKQSFNNGDAKKDTGSGFSLTPTTMMIIGAAAIGLILLMKKK